METIFVIVAIVFLVVYLFAQDSKKETTREKYGEAIGQVAHSAASTIAGIAHDIAEPASKRRFVWPERHLHIGTDSCIDLNIIQKKSVLKNCLMWTNPLKNH